MHMIANNTYQIKGFLYETVIPSFTDLVFLFMAVSAFGMCCGYFEKVMSNKINWPDFYKKRYGKILPFFACLIALDLVINFSVSSVFEGITELTLLHGFIPKELSVIGVGWFLGIVFIFYLVFPFFCTLIENKRRAWCAFIVSVILNFFCESYFGLERTNFLSSFCYFLAGGLVYLHKDFFAGKKMWICIISVIVAILCYYSMGGNTLTRLFVSAALLATAISVDFGENRVVSFLGGISMEFYLSHMVVFRAIEKLRINTMFGGGWLQYLITVAAVFCGTIVFSCVLQFVIKKVSGLLTREVR